MNKLENDALRGMIQYVVKEPEDEGVLRLVCRRWNGVVKQWSYFENGRLWNHIEDSALADRVYARIFLCVPKELPESYLCRRTLKEMSGDVRERAVAVQALRSEFVMSHLPSQIMSVAGLKAVEYESTRVESEWISILTELFPHHLAFMEQAVFCYNIRKTLVFLCH